ncbi:HD domain-containing protein, partial [bacterium]|nr:HD domain-containing protein [bacterium]
MSDENQNVQVTMDIENLDESMLITAYVGFDSRYDSMDEKLCKWIQHNFRGSSVIVKRNNEKMKLLVNEIMPGDNLCRVYKLPPSFVDITQVSQKLISELRSRGFNRFDVQNASVLGSEGQGNLRQAIQQANSFVQKVKKSIEVCENATQAIENLLDNSRQGNMNIDDMKNCVSNIKDNKSADAVSAIISMKENDQVYAHCVDVGVVFQTVYFGILKLRGEKSIFKDEEEVLLAAFLHDIGKARIPKDLLSSKAVFKKDSKEMELIRAHPQAGADMLAEIGMPDYIINMANYHHVKLDNTMGSSYPKEIEDKNILFETRLL